MLLKWLASRTIRKATDLRRQVQKLLSEQKDLLPADSIQAVSSAIADLDQAIRHGLGKSELEARMNNLVEVAESKLIPYPNASARENIKELFVAGVVILAFTTFFLQLTKIPTGSLQPTLFGITEEDLRDNPSFQMPGRLARLAMFWFHGIKLYQVTAKSDGELRNVEPPQTILPFIKRQRFQVGNEWYTVWFPSDDFLRRAGLYPGQRFQRGDDIIKLKVVSGDHLLVDRFTYNFRKPERGEIIVFKTRDLPGLPQDQLYIKRLVALGGERVQIGNDQHLIINGRRLDAATPHFENVYTFPSTPGKYQYFGHVNQKVAQRYTSAELAPLFRDGSDEYRVPTRGYLAMGDNTLNSRDSREWGAVPENNLIGKCWFVYWPFTKRFGWDTW